MDSASAVCKATLELEPAYEDPSAQLLFEKVNNILKRERLSSEETKKRRGKIQRNVEKMFKGRSQPRVRLRLNVGVPS